MVMREGNLAVLLCYNLPKLLHDGLVCKWMWCRYGRPVVRGLLDRRNRLKLVSRHVVYAWHACDA